MVNPQLAVLSHPLSLPEDLMRKLRGGYCCTKFLCEISICRVKKKI